MPYRAIKANIAESLNVIIVQLDRRSGSRMVSEVIAIAGFDAERDTYDLHSIYSRSQN
jgi:Flp pilus assembly CpaF family ATPase